MNPQAQRAAYLTRRQFFSKTATGIGSIALASLLQQDGFGALASGSAPQHSATIKTSVSGGAGSAIVTKLFLKVPVPRSNKPVPGDDLRIRACWLPAVAAIPRKPRRSAPPVRGE